MMMTLARLKTQGASSLVFPILMMLAWAQTAAAQTSDTQKAPLPSLEEIVQRLEAVEKELSQIKSGQQSDAGKSSVSEGNDQSSGGSQDTAETQTAVLDSDGGVKMTPGWAATVIKPAREKRKQGLPLGNFVLANNPFSFKDHVNATGIPADFDPSYKLEGFYRASAEGTYIFVVEISSLDLISSPCKVNWNIEGNSIINVSGGYLKHFYETGAAELVPGLYKMSLFIGCRRLRRETEVKILVKTPDDNAPLPVSSKQILHKVK